MFDVMCEAPNEQQLLLFVACDLFFGGVRLPGTPKYCLPRSRVLLTALNCQIFMLYFVFQRISCKLEPSSSNL